MFRLNRIRVKLSGSLKRQQCGILHNPPLQSLKAHGENRIEQYIIVPYFYCNIHLGQHSSTSCVVLITQSQPFAQRDRENVLKQSSQRYDSLPSLIFQHKPGLYTCNGLWVWSSQCSLSGVFYSYTSAQVTILAKKLCSCNPDSVDCCSFFCIMSDNLLCIIIHACDKQIKWSNCWFQVFVWPLLISKMTVLTTSMKQTSTEQHWWKRKSWWFVSTEASLNMLDKTAARQWANPTVSIHINQCH